MKAIFNLFLVLALMLVTACVATKSTSGVSNYSENISGYRPQFNPEDAKQPVDTVENQQIDQNVSTKLPEKDITKDINEIIDKVIERNEEVQYVNGYTIQVYSGTSREEANKVKSDIYVQVPDARPKQSFEAPNFKVQVGSFLEKIEAQQSYAKIKSHFPYAILIPTRIPNTYFINKN